MALEITIEPAGAGWDERLIRGTKDSLFGHSLQDWFIKTRRELGLDESRPIVATGHQTLLWHPGILIKYMVVDAVAASGGIATANLIVDQHADAFGDFDIPGRRADGSLNVRRMHLTTPRKGVPMGLHEPFTPPKPPGQFSGVAPHVEEGVRQIHDRVYAHRDAPNAARQMACALEDLMRPWIAPMTSVTASDLLGTTFAREMLTRMADDPWRCAEMYNEAVRAIPEAGVGALLIRDDYVELPLWRIREDGRRMHAYDNDVQHWLEAPDEAPTLMPRAFLLTALVRLGMCDVFVHGLGGANYDRAMERWIEQWLGVKPSAIAMATANLRLPLIDADERPIDLKKAQQTQRRIWHDPETVHGGATHPGSKKASLLKAIADFPYGSPERKAAFFRMHEELQRLRNEQAAAIQEAQRTCQQASMQASNVRIAMRRDWAFPLYPREMLDELAANVRQYFQDQAGCPG